MCPPGGGGGGKGPGPFDQMCPPGGGGGGRGPGPFAQIAAVELLEAEIVEALATTEFRNAIAPLKTSNTKATTGSHFDIGPPSWKTNPEALYVYLFHNDTGMCCV
jgi:hypothetical protein